jgi:hypothetical protein
MLFIGLGQQLLNLRAGHFRCLNHTGNAYSQQ